MQFGVASGGMAFKYDPATNANGSFSGDEFIFPNSFKVLTPNAANNGWHTAFRTTGGRFMVNSFTDNGADALQVTGSQSLSGVLKLGGATVGTIQNGSASISIWSKGAITLPTQFSTTPTGLANGDLWTDMSTSTDHRLRMRLSDVNSTIATREKDFAGGGAWNIVSANAEIDANRNARADGVATSFTLQGDLDMIEGLPYRYFFQRNGTNTITISAANMGGNVYYDGCATVGGCATMITSQNATYTITRIGTTLFVE
jgi:hypothetical protein